MVLLWFCFYVYRAAWRRDGDAGWRGRGEAVVQSDGMAAQHSFSHYAIKMCIHSSNFFLFAFSGAINSYTQVNRNAKNFKSERIKWETIKGIITVVVWNACARPTGDVAGIFYIQIRHSSIRCCFVFVVFSWFLLHSMSFSCTNFIFIATSDRAVATSMQSTVVVFSVHCSVYGVRARAPQLHQLATCSLPINRLCFQWLSRAIFRRTFPFPFLWCHQNFLMSEIGKYLNRSRKMLPFDQVNLLMEVSQFTHNCLYLFIVPSKRCAHIFQHLTATHSETNSSIRMSHDTNAQKQDMRQTRQNRDREQEGDNVPNLGAWRLNKDFVNISYALCLFLCICAVHRALDVNKWCSRQPDRFMRWTRLNLNSIINFKEI